MQPKTPSNIKGIDVSHHQGAIDWGQVAASGIRFAFIKATQGTSIIDSMLRRNAMEAPKHGILVGYYHFAENTGNAAAQAVYLLNAIKDLPCDLPLVLDIENLQGKPAWTRASAQAFALQFLGELEKRTGETPMIYTGAYFARDILNTKALAKYPLWIAHYGADIPLANDTWGKWSVFQFTSSGKVPGINGYVDLDLMEADFMPRKLDKGTAETLVQILKALWTLENTKLMDIKLHNGQQITKEQLHDLAEAVRQAGGLPSE